MALASDRHLVCFVIYRSCFAHTFPLEPFHLELFYLEPSFWTEWCPK